MMKAIGNRSIVQPITPNNVDQVPLFCDNAGQAILHGSVDSVLKNSKHLTCFHGENDYQ